MTKELITTHLWYDKEAREAAEFYTSIFADSKIKNITTIHDTPSGSADIVNIELAGQNFTLISAGPYFKFTPAVSLLVLCETTEEVETLCSRFIEGGTVMMELGKYPFSDKYGWLADKYDLSWQIMLADKREIRQKITPTLMFTGEVAGKSEEAINFYIKVFDGSLGQKRGDSKVGEIMRYGKNEEPDQAGTIKHAKFTLQGQTFAAMDSAYNHNFGFNEAVSFVVHCQDQKEIDYYWERLSAVPDSEQCGWLKDKYGLSWQIVPTVMDEMLGGKDEKRIARITQAFLKMKKFDIAELEKAYKD